MSTRFKNKDFGVLCHVTSLPSEYGVGDFGKSARDFIDFLEKNNIDTWQILPLAKTNRCNCPYGTMSSFTFDEMFIDPEDLLSKGYIKKKDLTVLKSLSNSEKVDYKTVKSEKDRLIREAYSNIEDSFKDKLRSIFEMDYDLRSFAYYTVLLAKLKVGDWRVVPREYLNKESDEYKKFIKENEDELLLQVFAQTMLDNEWKKIKKYANDRNIKIIGDVPIYSEVNSVDVFENPQIYKLDPNTFMPVVYGGSVTFNGSIQNWGTCMYNWEYIRDNGYQYFVNKFRKLLSRYDILRLDHYLGYVDHFEIDFSSNSGRWVNIGGEEFFNTLRDSGFNLDSFVIEDLGTEREEAMRVKGVFNLRGMCILQYAFQRGKKYYPEYAWYKSIYYLGTHDNNTFIGFLNNLPAWDRESYCREIGVNPYQDNGAVLVDSVKRMIDSRCEMIMVQIQDLLMQDGNYRMNIPGQAYGCWEYRVSKDYKGKAEETLNRISPQSFGDNDWV